MLTKLKIKGGLQMGESMKFTELDQYLFGQGTNYEVYKKLGAHPVTYRRRKGVYFAVWAPNARVSLLHWHMGLLYTDVHRGLPQ